MFERDIDFGKTIVQDSICQAHIIAEKPGRCEIQYEKNGDDNPMWGMDSVGNALFYSIRRKTAIIRNLR